MVTDFFNVLEFDKIRAKLRDCATSNFSKELAAGIEPARIFSVFRDFVKD